MIVLASSKRWETFGILFGKRVGGFARRAEEIIDGELDASPTIRAVMEALIRARANILEQIRTAEHCC